MIARRTRRWMLVVAPVMGLVAWVGAGQWMSDQAAERSAQSRGTSARFSTSPLTTPGAGPAVASGSERNAIRAAVEPNRAPSSGLSSIDMKGFAGMAVGNPGAAKTIAEASAKAGNTGEVGVIGWLMTLRKANQSGDLAAAARAAEQALALFDADPALRKQQPGAYAEALNTLYAARRRAGDNQGALDMLKRTIAEVDVLSAGSVEGARVNRASLLIEMGRGEEALPDLDRVLSRPELGAVASMGEVELRLARARLRSTSAPTPDAVRELAELWQRTRARMDVNHLGPVGAAYAQALRDSGQGQAAMGVYQQLLADITQHGPQWIAQNKVSASELAISRESSLAQLAGADRFGMPSVALDAVRQLMVIYRQDAQMTEQLRGQEARLIAQIGQSTPR